MSGKYQPSLEAGRFIEFIHPERGCRVGNVVRISGRNLTVSLYPYGIKGPKRGRRTRIRIEWVSGIFRGKRLYGYDYKKGRVV